MSTRITRRRLSAPWIALACAAAAAALVFRTCTALRPSPAPSAAAFPFPCLGHETLSLHVHPWLRIVVEGQPVTIPAGIGIPGGHTDPRGIVARGACFEPLHTHDASGIIHIEGPDPGRRYTLGDFFDVWRATYRTATVLGQQRPIAYSPRSLFGLAADRGGEIRLLVDGRPSGRGPELVLNTLDYCRAGMSAPPCWPTAPGDPFPPSLGAEYGTGHTIVLEYRSRP